MKKTILLVSILITYTLFSSGCTPFFINENKPKTIQEKSLTLDENNMSSQNKIKGFEVITEGIISDISSDGNNIVLLRPDISESNVSSEDSNINSLFLYNLKENEFQPIISPQVNITLSQFDSKERGFYYLENKAESIFQLFWIDDTGSKKVRISSSDHQVNPNYYVDVNNNVYYGTKDGKIIYANNERILSTIDIGSDYYIQQIYYYNDKDLILFSAYKGADLNLYSIKLRDKKPTLIIPKIIGSFNMSIREDKLLYMTPILDSNKRTLWLIDLESLDNTKLLEGFLNKITFSPQGNKIAYLDKTDSNTDLQNIWILDIKSKEKEQISSNLRITNELLWHPKKDKLFFSTFETVDNQSKSTIHSLDFSD